ncbi:hypothetical protein ACFSO7_18050 [Bacillus sp. CGMCC 1.16607]|uniref:hypothetical protein n=1 Tax=Bacillus sp. CGMCC 1.16607 TaxID=3351842 RepID=UPI003630363E
MKKKNYLLLVFTILILSGCMYPKEKLSQNQIPYEDQIVSVQSAVHQFQKDNGGILPIKTKEGTTPIYQKYLIDFQKIVPRYLSDIPGNAFESGGIFQYVLVDVEQQPKVKLLDLRITDTIRDIKLRISANGGYPPYKEKIGENVFSLDFNKIGYKEEPFAVSPYTNVNLPFVVGTNGEIYVDYRMDLYKKLKEEKNIESLTKKDIRYLLVKDSMFVPAYSLPYSIDEHTKEPAFMSE